MRTERSTYAILYCLDKLFIKQRQIIEDDKKKIPENHPEESKAYAVAYRDGYKEGLNHARREISDILVHLEEQQ